MKEKFFKLLVIDDSMGALSLIETLVPRHFPNAQVLKADQGFKGLELAQSENPDIILLDINMPVLDGPEVCRRLKAGELTADIPVVFLSGIIDDKTRMIALESGGEGFLYKPVDGLELEAQVAVMLRLREAAHYRKNEKQRIADILREKTEEALLKSGTQSNINTEILLQKKEFQRVISNLPVSLSIVTTSGNILYINPACARLFELDAENITGKQQVLVHWVNPEERLKWLDLIKTNGEVKNYEVHVRTLNGKLLWILASGLFITYEDQPCVLSTHLDITEVKQTQQALKENEERFSKAFLSSPYMLTITRAADGKIIEVNEAFIEASGYTRQEVLASSTIDLDIWVNLEDRRKYIEELLRTKQIKRREHIFQTKDRRRIVGLKSSQLLQINGEDCVISTIEDITDQKKAADQLKAHIDELERFHKLTVGRELAMIELKKEVNELLLQMGSKPKYPIVE